MNTIKIRRMACAFLFILFSEGSFAQQNPMLTSSTSARLKSIRIVDGDNNITLDGKVIDFSDIPSKISDIGGNKNYYIDYFAFSHSAREYGLATDAIQRWARQFGFAGLYIHHRDGFGSYESPLVIGKSIPIPLDYNDYNTTSGESLRIDSIIFKPGKKLKVIINGNGCVSPGKQWHISINSSSLDKISVYAKNRRDAIYRLSGVKNDFQWEAALSGSNKKLENVDQSEWFTINAFLMSEIINSMEVITDEILSFRGNMVEYQKDRMLLEGNASIRFKNNDQYTTMSADRITIYNFPNNKKKLGGVGHVKLDNR